MSTLVSRRTLLAGAAAATAAACNPTPASAGYVNVYSARHYATDQTLFDAFTAKTGVEVRVLQAAGDQLLERLRVEGDQTAADLILATDAGNLHRLQAANLLQPVTSEALTRDVPERLHETDGHWWGFTKRARVIVYRKDALDPATLTSMDDLATPRFAGQVVARSSTNVYNLSLLASRIARLGAENARAWAAGVKNNFARAPQGGDTDQIKAVAEGAAQVAISNHYYLVRMIASEDPADRAAAEKVGLVFPDQAGAGTHVNISGGGVGAHAERRAEAVALLEYLVSDEAQTLLAPLNQEYPIRPSIAPAPALAALGSFKEEDVPLSALGEHQAEAAQIFEAVGWL